MSRYADNSLFSAVSSAILKTNVPIDVTHTYSIGSVQLFYPQVVVTGCLLSSYNLSKYRQLCKTES